MKVQIINHLGGNTDEDIGRCSEVLPFYADMICVDYELAGITVTFKPGATVPDEGFLALGAFEDPDQSDCLGYHDEDPRGLPYGKVFRSMVPNGEMLHDKSGHGASLAGVFAHEFVEMALDRFANLWAFGLIRDPAAPSRTFGAVAYETADPVQDAAFTLRSKDGSEVDCSDYVTPNFFNPNTPSHELTSHLGTVSGPMVCGPGGYLIVAQEQGETQVMGRKLGAHHERVVHPGVAPAAWREAIRALKHSRSSRRARHDVG